MRRDGKRVKDADPMYTVIPYIMNKRYDAMNMINIDIPIEPFKNYIKKKRSEGILMSHLAIIIASYIRAMAYYPNTNRFVVNKKIYQRNDIDCAMVVLKDGAGDMEGTISKLHLDENDTVLEVQEKITDYINKNREGNNANSTDKMIKKLLTFPEVANLGVALFKFMDKYGLLSKKLIELSPFHTSFTITNLSSIRTNYIYHHVYEFGTTSVFIAMGNPREVPSRVKGEIQFTTSIPLGVVMDERICSGHYFAQVFQCMKKYCSNPELLEKSYQQELAEAAESKN